MKKIIRYGNRKLWTSKIGYISLDKVYKYILKGHKVKITNYDTSEDITNKMLRTILKQKQEEIKVSNKKLLTIIRKGVKDED